MKRKLLSLLLALCMLVSLFAGLSLSAAAVDGPSGTFLATYTVKAGDMLYSICDAYGIASTNANIELICKLSNVVNANYITPGNKLLLPVKSVDSDSGYYTLHNYTVGNGDSIASICNAYGGVNYDRDYKLITALNERINLNSLIAGQVLTLPVYVEGDGAEVVPDEDGGTVITSGDATVPDNGAAADGDVVSYYLISHVVEPGDTVYALCEKFGLNFTQYYDTIVKLNKNVNFNWMLPGTVILFPSKTVPTSGSYYAVYAHKTAAGDTVYGLCGAYGLNYYAYSDMICNLNNRTNLATFYIGETMYLPKYYARATAPAGTPANTAEETGTGEQPATPVTVITSGDAGTGNPVSIPGEDILNSLLVVHSMQAGETVSGVVAELGINYTWELEQQIMKYSGLTSLNWIMVGQLLYIPTTTYPPAGVPYYKIMAHQLVAGDTVYGLCETYGLKYLDNVAFIQRINNRNDLSTYYVGDTILMPVLVKNPAPVE